MLAIWNPKPSVAKIKYGWRSGTPLASCKTVIFKDWWALELMRDVFKNAVSYSVGMKWGLKFCISNKISKSSWCCWCGAHTLRMRFKFALLRKNKNLFLKKLNSLGWKRGKISPPTLFLTPFTLGNLQL